MARIQVVDLAAVLGDSPLENDFIQVGDEIAKSFEQTGFVFVKNHGIPQHVIDQTFQVSLDFFNLDEKIKMSIEKGPELQGWVAPERECANTGARVRELRECYDVRNLGCNGIFPDSSFPQLRKTMTKMCHNLIPLSQTIQRCISVSLGQNKEFLNSMTEGLDMGQDGKTLKGFTQFRTLYYPPIPDEILKNTDGIMRVGEHSDFGFITLLCQDETGGPEVETASGEWIYAQYEPGCILVNVGDLLEILTAGRFKATNHRLQVPQDEQLRQKKRQSIAFFVMPDHHAPIKPLLTGPNPTGYSETTSYEFSINRLKSLNGDAYGFVEEKNECEDVKAI